MGNNSSNLIIRQLGLQPYDKVLSAMHLFTDQRSADTADEIWLVQHHPVFTQGQAGKACHVLLPGHIPVVQSDRGGQVTYHGPGQQVMYCMLDLHRRNIRVQDLVTLLEQTIIATLSDFAISAIIHADTPGVYVSNGKKICSIGLRIRHGYSFHGLALNVAMDLTPFDCINPCGYVGMRMTQVSNIVPGIVVDDVAPVLIAQCRYLLSIR